jgi:hypothetical protein
MKLWLLALVLGWVVALPQVYGLMNPAGFRDFARKFPRSAPWGWALMLLGTAWFLWELQNERISDFAAFKSYLLIGFGAVGLGTCIFVRDFLAVRGLAVVLLMLAKLMVDTARWVHTDWRLVIVIWAYVLVVAGMWFTVSPWRLRDLIDWATRTDSRVRLGSALRLAFGLWVIILGLTVFRAAERPAAFPPPPAGSANAEPIAPRPFV